MDENALDFFAGLERVTWILSAGKARRVVIVGGTDTGKTWLCRWLAQWAWERGFRLGFLDFDLGQSTVGPPGCIGLQLPWEEGDDLLFPSAMAFLGYVSPAYDVGSVVEKGELLLSWADMRGYNLLVVDTSGMIHGPLAGLLKRTKIRKLRPDLVVALDREGETRHIFRGLEEAEESVVFVRPSPEVRVRERAERADYRASRLLRYFEYATPIEISLSGRRLCGTSPRVPADLSFLREGHLLGMNSSTGLTLAVARFEGSEEGRLKLSAPFSGDLEGIREISVGPTVLYPDGSLVKIKNLVTRGDSAVAVGEENAVSRSRIGRGIPCPCQSGVKEGTKPVSEPRSGEELSLGSPSAKELPEGQGGLVQQGPRHESQDVGV